MLIGARRVAARRVFATLFALALAGAVVARLDGGATAVTDRPNVVVILTDDQTYSSLAKMPYTNARGDWVRFTRAYANYPLCCPARATLLSGQYSHHTGVENNSSGGAFDDDNTIGTWLKGRGYRTGYIGKYLNQYPFGRTPFAPPGWGRFAAFTDDPNYYNYTLWDSSTGVKKKYGQTAADYSTDVLATKATQFIANTSPSPFFLFFAPYSPHRPFTPAPRHATKFNGAAVTQAPNFNEDDVSDKPEFIRRQTKKSLADMEEQRRGEWRLLQATDDAVKAIFNALSSKGVLNNTVVVFMSDHGYSFGEHRWETKRCEYEECVHIPMLVRYPGVTGRTVDALVTNADLRAHAGRRRARGGDAQRRRSQPAAAARWCGAERLAPGGAAPRRWQSRRRVPHLLGRPHQHPQVRRARHGRA